MHKRLAALLLAGVAAFVLQTPACAAASDTDLDTRVHALSEQLRCLVCQNQTLADSNADFLQLIHQAFAHGFALKWQGRFED